MIKEYQFNSWVDFKCSATDRLSNDSFSFINPGKFLFRGHENSEWPLESSFDRQYKKLKYDCLIKEFKNECHHLPELQEIAIKNNKTYQLTALGQHYGLPTRLLDWTKSQYIASFFAYEAALHNIIGESITAIRAEQKTVAIWALYRKSEFWKKHNIKIIHPSAEYNKRLYKQLGYFTVMSEENNVCSLDEFIIKKSEGKTLLWKFILPLADVIDVMADLSLMGIDANTILGGHEGRARSAINKIILSEISSNK